ncbi:hypothetical protein [Euzebya tangerina]|uniref:hypothetical protein n=1 Tax=Euzebya tangerina TaxID=591198 RepID=UPI000E317E0D|nr:hypothetical protein [Euzebya tangerina]
MIFREVAETATSFRASVDAATTATARFTRAVAALLGAIGALLNVLKSIDLPLATLNTGIIALTRALRRIRTGPPPLVALATVARQVLVVARRLIRTVRVPVRRANTALANLRRSLLAAQAGLNAAATQIPALGPQIQQLIDVANALEPQQDLIEPLLPPELRAQIRALLADLRRAGRELDEVATDLNVQSTELERVSAILMSIAQDLNAQTQALRSAVSSFDGIVQSIADAADYVEEFINDIPGVGALLSLLDDVGDFIDDAIQSFLDATGISGLIRDAINALADLDELVTGLGRLLAEISGLNAVIRAVNRIVSRVTDAVREALDAIVELLTILNGLALIKFLLEWVIPWVCERLDEEIEYLGDAHRDVDDAKASVVRLRRYRKDLAATSVAATVPAVQLAALDDVQQVVRRLDTATRSLSRSLSRAAKAGEAPGLDAGIAHLEDSVRMCRDAAAAFPPCELPDSYFEDMGELIEVPFARAA